MLISNNIILFDRIGEGTIPKVAYREALDTKNLNQHSRIKCTTRKLEFEKKSRGLVIPKTSHSCHLEPIPHKTQADLT